MTTETEREFIAYLKGHPKVTWIVELDGDLNFLYTVWAKDIHEFQLVYEEVNDRYGKYIQQKFFSVMTSVYYFKDKYLVGKEDETFLLTGGAVAEPRLDGLDRKLITLLSNEGRLSLVELGERLGSDAKAIQRRKRRLEEEGIITGYNVKVDHKLLGWTQRKVMLNLNDNSKQAIKRLTHFIARHPSTIYITIAIGQYDFEFEMMERSHEEFHQILKELKNTFPGLVRDSFTVIFYDEPKVGQLAME
jgi:Lrp/AsnC family transcriptional regulator, leucine-responsive regulatory protein